MKKDNTKRNKMIWTIIIVVLMSSSMLGYAIIGDTSQNVRYNGIKFARTQLGWEAEINKQTSSFYYHPLEVEYLTFTKEMNDLLKDKQTFYITFDPESKELEYLDLARFELVNTMYNQQTILAESATTNESSYGFNVLDCSDATELVPVVKMQFTNTTEFKLQDNCLLLNARTGPEMLALKDRLVYSILGVIE